MRSLIFATLNCSGILLFPHNQEGNVMSTFIIRIELHGAEPEDYEELHEKMEGEGYQRQIIADSGNEYQLPDAEYIIYAATGLSVTDIAQAVYKIADSVKANPGVLVTEAANIEVIGLLKPIQ